MNKMKMEKRMVIRFRDLDAHWSRDVYDVCDRFLQVAALMQQDDYLGFEVVATQDQGYQVGVFANAHAWISFKDFTWIFDNCASVEELLELPKKEFEEEKQFLYVVKRQASVNLPRTSSQSDKDFSRRFTEFVDMLVSHNASLRIVARPGRENGRGLFYVSLPQIMSLSMEAAIVRLFPSTVIREVQGCNDEISITNWLTQTQMIDSMMGMVGLLKKQDELLSAQLLEDDGLFDVDIDDIDDILEEDTSEGEEEYYQIPGDTSIEELEFSVRTFNCLMRNGIKTVAQLRGLTEVDLHNIRNLGEKGMCEIREKLKEIEHFKKKVDYSKMLSELVGLENVKEQVERVVSFSKLKQELKLRQKNCDGFSLNMEFVGNPGTAKTTVARILAGIFYENGLINSPEIMEVGRVDLIAGYVGQTAEKVQKLFERARGRLLFIDEAYSLVEEGRNYCGEAISTLVQEMENHRDETIVIFAGYPDNMKEFFEMNPGLRSRVPFQITFADYSVDEMIQITELEVKKRGFEISPEADERIGALCEEATKKPKAGNGRFCRNLAESAILNYATRLFGKNKEKEEIDFVLKEKDFSYYSYLTENKEVAKSIGF